MRFHQNPLSSKDDFRLLKLHAGQGERIECSLHHHTLRAGQCPPYHALSYTWGRAEQPQRHVLHLPGQAIIGVRENLYNALFTLQDPDIHCWLWVDGPCIHQNLEAEPSQQVALMAKIFGNADVVVSWLHNSGKEVDEVH